MAHSGETRFGPNRDVPLWLDGKEVTISTTFDVVSPNTGEVLYKSASASTTDAQAAVDSAQRAFETWSQTKPSTRRDILLRAADGLLDRKEELFQISHRETGIARSMFEFEFNAAVDSCKTVAGLIPAMRGFVPTLAEEGKSGMVLREPYGVVLSIAPWNAPYGLGFRACLGPLAMGNTVILKGAEACPATYWAISSVLHEAGLPQGCLNTLIHRLEDAAQVTSHLISAWPIRKINFTGSTRTGAIIASQAAKLSKPIVLELGGKAPTIVCDDADLEDAAAQSAVGAFLHGGQICMSTERIIVHAAVAGRFKALLKATLSENFSQQEGLVLINEQSVLKNRQLVRDAVSKGAEVVHGEPDHQGKLKTALHPVVIEKVNEKMDIYHTESFGPTVSLFTVESDDEAIRLANDTEYGLTSAVFTQNLQRGLRIAKRIQSGAVHINSMSVHDESALPHGGRKSSGFGRFNSIEGLEEWVQTKTITWRD
ncbi:uncharacterized protein Z520_12060 [Fonsecaea multimorphosa CBS 102226]|uniref:Aldehyde dehydrogenase domain-containing protein n=1 Tax=Fonsecaea multimorphosa CBS 102226 TaxID=1442371 RepID=A0A0D2JNW9_9EURO|nr:uncharacterized protein Z520_12060 [Fonsecaea multimorphosa CBS 102226]KIX92179.1 hypothetical protein Z520_12060 [Fonsecaea multimorphosa CBS 102226]OAL17612.1 hypothetical protein AYO22_11474 [Fonsecaea multimorphosa]